jgi:hypothetical protein
MTVVSDAIDGGGMLPTVAPSDLARALDALATLEALSWWPDARLKVLRRVQAGESLGAISASRLTGIALAADSRYREAAGVLRQVAAQLEDPDAGVPTDDGH